jgi:predicted permease
LTLDGNTFEVIGITPASFYGIEVGRNYDVAIPICTQPVVNGENNYLTMRHAWWLATIGRLKPGVSEKAATADLQSISAGIFEETLPPNYQAEEAKNYLAFKLQAQLAPSGVSTLRTTYQSSLWLLLATSGLVLLIACANIANLMLARANARVKEISVRLAIGASRGRLIRQLLAESVLLAAIGAVAGAFVAQGLSRVLLTFLSTSNNPLWLDFRTDWRLLLFMGGLAALTCLVFGLVPALRGTQIPPAEAMRSSGRGFTSGRERINFRRVLVVSQVALSLVLLVGAVLFARSLGNLLTLNTGFQREGVLLAHVNAARLELPEPQRAALFNELAAVLRSVPGVDAVARAGIIPLSGSGWNDNVLVHKANGEKQERALSNFNRVSSGYFRTMGTPLIAGRQFDDVQDGMSSPRVAIVDQTFVEKVLQGANPIGVRFEIETGPGEARPIYEIIGLVQNAKYQTLREEFSPTAYVPTSQDEHPISNSSFVIRSAAPLTALTPLIKSAIMAVSDDASLRFEVYSTKVRETLLQERLMATLSGFFGLLAALLATIGVYGMLSYTVTQRRSEIGIRMVLGANRRGVVMMILREAGALLLIGLIIGTTAALAVAKTAETLLYGLQPRDPLTIAIAVTGLGFVTLAASYIPARRAATLEPGSVLKEE